MFADDRLFGFAVAVGAVGAAEAGAFEVVFAGAGGIGGEAGGFGGGVEGNVVVVAEVRFKGEGGDDRFAAQNEIFHCLPGDRGMRLSFAVDIEDANEGTTVTSRPAGGKRNKKKSLFTVEPDSDHEPDIPRPAEKSLDDTEMDLEWEAAQMKKVLGNTINGNSVTVNGISREQFRNTDQSIAIPDIHSVIAEKRAELQSIHTQLDSMNESSHQLQLHRFDDNLLQAAEEHYEYLLSVMQRQPIDDALMQEWREKYPSDFDYP